MNSTVMIAIVLINSVTGICAGCSGLIVTLQMGFIAPSTFALHNSILYISVILVAGYKRVDSIAVGSLVFALLPELLRISGFGNVEASAWRGVIVGAVILCVILLQIPRSGTANSTR
jgi:ABC-type branched-subunit amino acid transport system permease subunit